MIHPNKKFCCETVKLDNLPLSKYSDRIGTSGKGEIGKNSGAMGP
jgi:hypothetical protein